MRGLTPRAPRAHQPGRPREQTTGSAEPATTTRHDDDDQVMTADRLTAPDTGTTGEEINTLRFHGVAFARQSRPRRRRAA